MSKRLSLLMLAALLAVAAFAGGQGEAPAEQETRASVRTGDYGESPMLAERVEAGELPAVDERLPVNPVVLTTGTMMPPDVLEVEIGKYGGTFIDTGVNNVVYRESFFVTSNLGDITSGNILEDWSINDDFTEYVFTLREGIRWSDGVPVTTEDVRFTYEDVMQNEELTPAMPGILRSGGSRDGEPMRLEILDEYSWRMTFDRPHPEFLVQLRQIGGGYYEFIKPKHYLTQFHREYASESDLQALIDEEELDTWVELFYLKDLTGWNYMGDEQMIGFPTLSPWIPVEYQPDRIVAERNPYYFAVDAEGNQLPYLDRIVSLSPEGGMEDETKMLRLLGGEADYTWSASLANLPLFKENEAPDTYVVKLYGDSGSRAFFLNLTYDDEIWRQFTWDPRFRRAVNAAIDYQEIIDELYFGIGSLSKAVPHVNDQTEANALLDEVGLTDRDGDGYRLRPDGEPFGILIETVGSEYTPVGELIAEHLKAVGLKAEVRSSAGDLLGQRQAANQHQATISWNRAVTWDVRHNHDYLPDNKWAPLWGNWYGLTGGDSAAAVTAAENAERPPEWMMDLLGMHEEIMSTVPGSPEDKAAFEELYAWFTDQVPYFTYVDAPALVHVFSTRIGNVPDDPAYHHGQWWVRKVQYIK